MIVDFIVFKFIIHFKHFGCAHKSLMLKTRQLQCIFLAFAVFWRRRRRHQQQNRFWLALFLWHSLGKHSWIWYCGIVVLFTRNSKISIRFEFHRILLDFDISTKVFTLQYIRIRQANIAKGWSEFIEMLWF